MRLNSYSDPGHGWVAVPLALLERMNLLDQITSYSYMRGLLAHLEEDCDLSTFMHAASVAGMKITFKHHSCPDRHSRIRNYDPYSPERARRNLANARQK
jgi:hypothetical protein